MLLRLKKAALSAFQGHLPVTIESLAKRGQERESHMLGIALAVVLVLAFLALLPQWGHRQWTYYPTGRIGMALLVVIVLLLIGRL